MRILFLNADMDYAGASKMMVFVANTLAEYGHEVFFLTYRNGDKRQYLNPKIIHEHIQLETEGGRSITSMLRCIRVFHKYIKKNRFDAAVAFLSPSQLRLAFARIGTNTKLLYSHRADPTRENGTGLIAKLNKIAFAKADYYAFQTHGARNCFCDEIKERSCIIPNPISKIDNISDGNINRDKRIVITARLDIVQKRQDILIEAFNKLCKYTKDYTLDLYGDGADEEKLRELAEGNDKIVFHGAVSDVLNVIKNASMFVLTSDFEGIPNALMEAMAVGLPCISTDCSPGGAALLIENHTNGILVPCGDSDAICDAMKFYIDNPDKAEKYGEEAKKVSDDFSESVIADKWIRAVEKLK